MLIFSVYQLFMLMSSEENVSCGEVCFKNRVNAKIVITFLIQFRKQNVLFADVKLNQS